MMGHQATGREQLFYSFSMEDHVPEDHLLRGIHRYLDLRPFRQHMEAFYSPIGRPSVDPELMIRMLIVGYCFGIRSERRLCEEVHHWDQKHAEGPSQLFTSRKGGADWPVRGTTICAKAVI